MGEPNSDIGLLWRNEFEKNNIGFNEIVFIGNNLGNLDNPGFIPNVFQLIKIVKDDPERKIAHERKRAALPHFPSEQEIMEQRSKTQKSRASSLGAMRNILNA